MKKRPLRPNSPQPDAGRRVLSPRDVAAALGVSESSLKRWVDEGLIEATRTAGGHRRILASEAIRYVRQAGLRLERPELLGLGASPEDGHADPTAVAGALRRADPATARALLVGAFLGGASIATICDTLIRPALAAIGEEWVLGPRGIVDEHRATETLMSVLVGLRGMLPDPGEAAPVAIGAGAPSDPYFLPTLAASAVLWEAGFRSVNLGADLPPSAITEAIVAHQPLLVWMSVSAPVTRERYADLIAPVAARATRAGARFVVGGRGAAPVARPPVATEAFAGSMVELASMARGILARGRTA